MKVTRILVPTDFSDASAMALDYAVNFARPLKAEILLLHVVEPVYFAVPPEVMGGGPDLSGVLTEQREAASEQLAKVEATLRRRQQPFRAFLETGPAHQGIIDAAERLDADMIIVATHGRTGVAHLLLGSVAERVVRSAPCPVLTIRDYPRPRSDGRRRSTAKRRGKKKTTKKKTAKKASKRSTRTGTTKKRTTTKKRAATKKRGAAKTSRGRAR